MTSLFPVKSHSPSWIESVVRLHADEEAPLRYWWWSAASIIASTVSNEVYLPRGGKYNLYPNLYVALISKDSGLKKSGPINLVKRVLNRTNRRVLVGRSSIQAIISTLSKQITLPNGRILSGPQATITSNEFCTMLINDKSALDVFTDLYDTHSHTKDGGGWTNTLKSSGDEVLNDVCINLLFGSNLVQFNETVQSKDRQGGFIARTMVVYEAEPNCINPLTDEGPELSLEPLIGEIEEISKMKGAFSWTDREAKQFYDDWYINLRKTPHNDKTGTINRLGDTVLKVAMILNLAKTRDMVIHKVDLEEAIDKCNECLYGTGLATRKPEAVDFAAAKLLVTDLLYEHDDWFSKEKIAQKLSRHYAIPPTMLSEVMLAMIESQSLDISRPGKSKYDHYRLSKLARELYRNIQKAD